MRAPIPLALFGLALALLGCGGDLEQRKEVTDLRLLVISADPPQVAPGDTVTLSALIVDPTGEPWTQRWSVCLTPVIPLFFEGPGGDDDPTEPAECAGERLDLGTGEAASFEVPSTILDDARAALPPELGAVGGVVLGLTGVWLEVQLSVESGDKTIDAFKRVVVSEATPVNTPPEQPVFYLSERDIPEEDIPKTAEIPADRSCLADTSPLKTIGRDPVRLTPLNIPDTPETYQVLTFEGELVEREERYHYSWFSAGPGLSDGRTRSDVPAAVFRLGEEDEARLVDLGEGDDLDSARGIQFWLVVRDGRGGSSWCHSVIPFVDE